ncbi:MAG: hypothetical protein DDT19_01519 [Syntrophomonadaceae bacterium]|nr:hypothetical protein [Bacillota bacterium]
MRDSLLTPEQIAETLQLSVLTVKHYLRRGVIQGHKIGKLWRVREEDLQVYIESRKATSQSKGRHKARS